MELIIIVIVLVFKAPNNAFERIRMRFGLEEDDSGEKVARMRLDNSEYREINKYKILIGNVSALDGDINKSTFYQSVDIAGQSSCNSLLIGGIDIDTKIRNSTGSTISQADLDLKQDI
jgi:hypothetical protein